MTAPTDESSGKTDVAKQQASRMSDATQEHASAVAGTAKEQASGVVTDAKAHAQDLLSQTTDQVGTQADEQTQRLAGNLQQLSGHFASMASSGEPGSTAHTLVEEAGRRSGDLADYLDSHGSAQIIDDVKSFARRRPGAFILGSAVAGLLVGRLGRAVKDAPEPESIESAAPATHEPVSHPSPDSLGTSSVSETYPPVAAEPVTVVPTADALGSGL